MDFTWLSRWQPQLLAILRIMTALLFLQHGVSKFFGFPVPFPMPGPLPPMLIAAGLIEIVAGVLIALGLFTRLAAFIASGQMAVAYFIGHFPRGLLADPEHGGGGDPVLLRVSVHRRGRAGRVEPRRRAVPQKARRRAAVGLRASAG